ncbi:MAG: serine hydrolase [Patescibacteria group bacterium]
MRILKTKKEVKYEEESRLQEKKTRKKRRKERQEPWGKKERLLVLFILVVTVGSSAVLALSSRSWKLPGLPRLKIPTFNLPFGGEETIVIEGDRELISQRETSEEIIQKFKKETEKLSGVYGLYVVDLGTGFSYGVNEKEVFEPASLNKLPVMAAMYIEEELGNLDLEAKYTLKNSDKVAGAGSLSGRPEGYELTYRNLIRLMGKQSDNTAFNVAKNLIGEEIIEQVTIRIGMKDTSLLENETTPRDIGAFFDELWQGNVINSERKNELLDYLTDTIYEEWLTKGVPDEIRVSHKYGREVHVVNDAGIIYAEKPSGPDGPMGLGPFVLVILSKGAVEREAAVVIPRLARIVYEAQTR